MKTYFGVDYHKAFSYGVIIAESGEIIKRGCIGPPILGFRFEGRTG